MLLSKKKLKKVNRGQRSFVVTNDYIIGPGPDNDGIEGNDRDIRDAKRAAQGMTHIK